MKYECVLFVFEVGRVFNVVSCFFVRFKCVLNNIVCKILVCFQSVLMFVYEV